MNCEEIFKKVYAYTCNNDHQGKGDMCYGLEQKAPRVPYLFQTFNQENKGV